ncbi:MAG: tetratricopeptide repeat protein [Caldilineaceae bacterium]
MCGANRSAAPAQLLAQLQDHRLDLLVDGARDLPPRQRTLRLAIGYSYALLNEAEQLLLRTLGVFASGFAIDAVEALAVDKLESSTVQTTLHALIGKSLVRAETTARDAPRFLLLETIREFALEQLTANGETEQLRQRHADYFCGRAALSPLGLAGQAASRQLDQLERDHDNLRLALQWLIEHDARAAQGMVGALCDFWYIRGHYGEGRRWAKAALAANHVLSRQRAAALYTGSRLAFTVDDYDGAWALSEESLAIYRQLEDLAGIATVLHDVGWIAYQMGRYAEAHLIFDENVAACRRLGDKQKLARALNASATVYVLDGVAEQYGLARSHFAENLQLAQAIDWQEGVAYAWQGSAMLDQKLGNYRQAMLHLEQALVIFRTLGFQRNEALMLRGISEAAPGQSIDSG